MQRLPRRAYVDIALYVPGVLFCVPGRLLFLHHIQEQLLQEHGMETDSG